MKLILSIVVALTVLNAQAAEKDGGFASGLPYYAAAQFRKAAARFQVLCNTNNDAEACYWAGLSYERQADISIPFGCKIDAKAHEYLAKAMKLAPGMTTYRNALFDFLLDTADCSRTALREAAGILSAMPASDPDHNLMLSRLEEERHLNGSPGAHLAKLFLLIPRATYRMTALPAAALTNRGSATRCGRACSGAVETTGTRREGPSS